MRVKSNLILCLSLCFAACGGSQTPAEEPAAESTAPEGDKDKGEDGEGEKPSDAKPDAEESAAKDKPEAKKGDPETSTSGPKITRTPTDILTAPDVIFMFSFNQSDMKDEAEKQCDKEAKDDPKKRADCMTKAKKKMIEADGIAFKKEKGSWYWLTISRKGKVLTNLHKLPIEFTKEDDHSIVLKPIGKDEGKSRAKPPGETKVEVPNEYEIWIKDPKYGKMVYEAKVGLVGEQPR